MKAAKLITREDEVNVICYSIPGSNDFIMGRIPGRGWVVNTSYGVVIYSTNEMEEVYNLDLTESNLERLSWPA